MMTYRLTMNLELKLLLSSHVVPVVLRGIAAVWDSPRRAMEAN